MIVFTVIAVFGQGSYSEPIGVAVVLLAIALLGMNTGLKSQKSAKELKDRTSIHYCNVIRDGKVEHINSNDLVVGDLVIIQSGEAIHADGYLVEGNVKVDNSVLKKQHGIKKIRLSHLAVREKRIQVIIQILTHCFPEQR